MPHGAHRISLGPFGNTGLRPLRCVPLDRRQLWAHQATGVARLLLSQVEVVPQLFLAIPGQTDVGISGSLQTGLGFFGHPNAAPARPALRLGRLRPA
jgi:hypothetical protein